MIRVQENLVYNYKQSCEGSLRSNTIEMKVRIKTDIKSYFKKPA